MAISVLMLITVDFSGEKCRDSKIKTSTLFTRLQQALKLKFASLYVSKYICDTKTNWEIVNNNS